MNTHVKGFEPFEDPYQIRGNSLGKHHRDLGSYPYHLDMGYGEDFGEQPFDSLIGQGKGVSSGNYDIAYYRGIPDVFDGFLPMLFQSFRMTTYQSGTGTISTIDRTKTRSQKKGTVRIPVHNARDRTGVLFMQRVFAFTCTGKRFPDRRDDGFSQCIGWVFEVD
jgi:hypothetical protein